MNKYELALVVSAKIEDDARTATVEKAKEYITRAGGTVTEVEEWGIHGRVARIAGQQRVVVELFEGYLVATAYIPKDAIKIIND